MQVTHLRAQIPQGKEKNQKVSLLAMYTNLRILDPINILHFGHILDQVTMLLI